MCQMETLMGKQKRAIRKRKKWVCVSLLVRCDVWNVADVETEKNWYFKLLKRMVNVQRRTCEKSQKSIRWISRIFKVLESTKIVECACEFIILSSLWKAVDGGVFASCQLVMPCGGARVHIQNHNLWTHQDHISRSHNQFEKVNRNVEERKKATAIDGYSINLNYVKCTLHYTFRMILQCNIRVNRIHR